MTFEGFGRGKTIQGWVQESKKQRRLHVLIMVLALEFTCFFRNFAAALIYGATNYSSCEICRESVILRNICPWAFFQPRS